MTTIIKAYSDVPRQAQALGTTPPVVTALPSNPQFGEQVTYYTVSGGYQAYQFVGTGWKILGRETPTFLTASSTNMETGPASSDFTYSAAQITITPGTWIVEAGARLINTVTTDAAAVAVWNETLGSEVPNSRGAAGTTLTSLAFALLSRRTTLTVSSDTDLRVRCLRNGNSTIRVLSANASAGWPAAYVNAERIQIVEATA